MHGDAVKDVAFTVSDCKGIFEQAVKKGAKVIKEPWTEKDDFGQVTMATIATVIHSCLMFSMEMWFILLWKEKITKVPFYLGMYLLLQMLWLPNCKMTSMAHVYREPVHLLHVDHVVGNQPDHEMVPACD
jgi:4-hydroxyphenylpyruvate dioxygenase